jgi:hypothetical protein
MINSELPMDTKNYISHIHGEIESALGNLYSIESYLQCVRRKNGIEIVNRNPASWKRYLANYQKVLFLNLGRIFDAVEGARSFPKFQGHCAQNFADFSAQAIEKRRLTENNGIRPDYLDSYLTGCSTPSKEELIKHFSAATSINGRARDIYQRIRSKVIAHAIWTKEHEYEDIFREASYNEIEQILLTVYAITNNIWNSFYNGRLYEKDYLIFEYRRRDEIYENTSKVFYNN